MKKLLLSRIRRKIDKAEVVSFDIFDTLLVRPYVAPTDLFVHMEKALNRPGFASERRDAERRCRIRHKELEDITFDMIYDEIDEEYRDLKQNEMDWEEMVLRANPELKQVYDYALAKGKRVIIASDMYLPTDFIAKVLRKNGYDNWEKLYVSGDVGKKKTRSLFYAVITELNVHPENILHIGDNPYSDYGVANLTGIRSILIPKLIEQYIDSDPKVAMFYQHNDGLLSASILLGVFSLRWQEKRCGLLNSSYWYELGYQYTGPLAYGFMRFVDQRAKENNIDNLLFIARSGNILKKVYETMGTGIKTTYIYAQRIFKTICHLKYEYPEEMIKIVDYFCKRSDVLRERLKAVKELTKESALLFFRTNYDLFKEVADQNLACYHDYVSSLCDKSERLMLVDDMAGSFSAQYLLEESLGKQILGAYILVHYRDEYKNYNRTLFSETYVKKSLTSEEEDVWSHKWHFVEFLLSSPEAAATDISKERGIIQENADDECYEKEHALNAGALAFTEYIKSLFAGYDVFFDYKTLIWWINCYLLNPVKDDYKYFRSQTMDWKSFNNSSLPFIVKPRRFSNLFFMNYKPTQEMHRNFYWPPDYRAVIFNGFTDLKGNQICHLFGIPVYKKIVSSDTTKTKLLFGLLKKKRTKQEKSTYLMGICIRKKSLPPPTATPSNARALLTNIQRMNRVANLHSKTFCGFKNKHQDQTVTLIGAGPTVNFFSPIPGCDVHVGLNRAFLYDKVKFDYLFAIDKAGLDLGTACFYDGFFNYDCLKFVGDQNLGINFQIPESVILRYKNILRYATIAGSSMPNKIAYDLMCEPLANFATVSLQAMQFIMYTNPKRVYIVGIDCTAGQNAHFYGASADNSMRKENLNRNDKTNIFGWKTMRDFVQTYYPDTQIISVNPVGLKGVFQDVYTRSYLKKHPEIAANKVSIID